TYTVERTASKNVPVYDDKRAGGTRRLTLIKKVVGNAQDLKNDIISDLHFNKDDVSVNPVTGHVVIKGHFQHKVSKWLEARGF
ncbi:ribosomal protein L49/IMG2, partial [Coniella lustricola]